MKLHNINCKYSFDLKIRLCFQEVLCFWCFGLDWIEIFLFILELFVGTELGAVLKSSNSGGTVNEGTSSLFLLGMELGN